MDETRRKEGADQVSLRRGICSVGKERMIDRFSSSRCATPERTTERIVGEFDEQIEATSRSRNLFPYSAYET